MNFAADILKDFMCNVLGGVAFIFAVTLAAAFVREGGFILRGR